MQVSDNNVLFSVKGLKKNFGDLEVLKGIDIDIHQGEVLVIEIGRASCRERV